MLSLRGAVPKAEKGHIPAAVDLADVRRVAEAVEHYPTPVTRAALRIAMLTAQRPGNVVAMEWAEVNLEAGEWSIPAAKMKTRHAHITPCWQSRTREAADGGEKVQGRAALVTDRPPHVGIKTGGMKRFSKW